MADFLTSSKLQGATKCSAPSGWAMKVYSASGKEKIMLTEIEAATTKKPRHQPPPPPACSRRSMLNEVKVPSAYEFITAPARKTNRKTNKDVASLIKHIVEQIDTEDQKAQLRRIGMAAVSIPRGYTWNMLQEAIDMFNNDTGWNIYTRNIEREAEYSVIVQPTREVALRVNPNADR
jgi:hypothetical protein